MEKKIFLFLADGFEEIEALTVVDVLRRAKHDIDMVSITNDEIVIGSHNISVLCDKVFANCDFLDVSGMLILPGGGIGTKNLENCRELEHLLIEYAKDNRPIAAICAAPSVLGKLGLLKGYKATCYPGYEDTLIDAKVEDKQVVIDGNFITGRGAGAAMEFALSIVEFLDGKTRAEELAKEMCVK